jgi:hypothetical protein
MTQTDWHVVLEVAGELTEPQVDTLVEALRPYSGVVSGAPGFPTYGATFTLRAPSVVTAAAAAVRTLERLTPKRPLHPTHVRAIEIRRQADVEREIDQLTSRRSTGPRRRAT